MRHNVIYHVRGALQEKVDGSANILIAVVEGYHTLILVLSSYLHQLEESNKHTSY